MKIRTNEHILHELVVFNCEHYTELYCNTETNYIKCSKVVLSFMHSLMLGNKCHLHSSTCPLPIKHILDNNREMAFSE